MKLKITIIVLLIVLFGVCFHLTDLWCFFKANTTNGLELFKIDSSNRQQACHIVWYSDYLIFVTTASMLLTTLLSAHSSNNILEQTDKGKIRGKQIAD